MTDKNGKADHVEAEATERRPELTKAEQHDMICVMKAM